MPLPRAVRTAAVLAAAALGFAASEALSARDGSPDDVIALEAETPADPELLPTDGGGLAVSLAVAVRNAGAQDVVLDGASVPGLSLVDDAASGLLVSSGATRQLLLQREVECAAESPRRLTAPAPLTLTTTRATEERSVPLRIDQGLREVDELARRAGGRLTPGQALQLDMTSAQVVNGVSRLGFEVRNGSTEPLELRELLPAPGLRVRLLDRGTGEVLRLPLQLPPGLPSTGRPSAARPQPALQVTAVVLIDDCGSPLPGSAFRGGPPFSLAVAGASGVESASFGELGGLLGEMEAESCP